ncbi:putative head-tail adaptor [Lachnospiraceae bacterium TWA4]|nr:putative head-tail adaptor [Lachnospiraceae bacterium TWA4]
MKISDLNVRICLQKQTVVKDEIGNHSNQWKAYYSCYAKVSSGGVSEQTESSNAGVIVSHEKLNFVIRWCKKVDQITSIQYRVEYKDEVYDILSIDELNAKKKYVKLICQKVRI